MCGRYASSRSDTEIADAFRVEEIADEGRRSYNVAPQTQVRLVVDRSPKGEPTSRHRQLRNARWGLVPHWAKDPSIGNRLINARSETILDKPSFRNAARKHRAIIPADGYFEWQKLDEKGRRKQPYFLHAADGGLLAMAGLYEWRRDPDLPADRPDAWQWTCTVLTTTASDTLGQIHDRSPVIVPADLLDDWLNPALEEPDAIRGLLAAMPEPHLVPRPVGKAVGDVRNDGPELIEEVSPELAD